MFSQLQISNKVGAILTQLDPTLTVGDFRITENFLDRLHSCDDRY